MTIYLFHNISKKPQNRWEVSPDDLMKIVNEIKIGDLDQTEIHFDDARVGVHRFAYKLLRDLTSVLKVVVFVPTGWIEGYVPKEEKYSDIMNWNQIAELKDAGFEIGSHSITHRNLTLLSRNELKAEVRHSRDTLKKKLNLKKVDKFSYPYGAYTKQVVNKVQKTYCSAYCLERPDYKRHNMLPKGKYIEFLIPRTIIISR
jgi:hypothetical protein